MKQFVILGRSQVDGMRVAEFATLAVRDNRGSVTFAVEVDGVRSQGFTERGPKRTCYSDAMDDARRLFRDRMRVSGSSDDQIDAWLGIEVTE